MTKFDTKRFLFKHFERNLKNKNFVSKTSAISLKYLGMKLFSDYNYESKYL